MPDLLLYFSTVACWLVLCGVAWRASRPAVAAGPEPRSDLRFEMILVPVALVLHAMLLYRRVVVADGLDLGIANAISMLVWLTVAIYWLAGLAFQGLSSVLGLMSPVALVAVLFQAATQTRHVVTYGGDPLFTLHFGIALLAYSLFTVATVHALVMLAEEKWLHGGKLPPFLKELPPLMQMEALLACSAFFAMSETCLMAVNRYRLKHLIREGSRGARLAGSLLDRTDELLAFILAGNTIINAAITILVAEICRRLLGTGDYVLAVATLAAGFFILVFAEIIPKVIGATYAEPIALAASYVLAPLIRVTRWPMYLVNVLVKTILGLMLMRPQSERPEPLGR